MSELKYTGEPLFYIDYFDTKTGKLTDISETGYKTDDLCQLQIHLQNKADDEFKEEILAKYEEDLKNFVLDNDTSDREPIFPFRLNWRSDKKSHLYILDKGGYHDVAEHVIEGLTNLQANQELIKTVNFILNETLDPRTFSTVREWLDVCFYSPCSDELKMFAINIALGGYGIESIRTSKWKNGHWCDILCTYVNMGDTYIPTVIHHRKHGFMVSSIGDVIEKNKHVI